MREIKFRIWNRTLHKMYGFIDGFKLHDLKKLFFGELDVKLLQFTERNNYYEGDIS